jgi:hypothetical protein
MTAVDLSQRKTSNMKSNAFLYYVSVSLLTATLSGISSGAWAKARTYYGEPAVIGNGTVRTYVRLDGNDAPIATGVIFPKFSLEGLPAKRNNTSRCFDKNGNGKIDERGECEGDYEIRLPLPAALAKQPQVVVKWVGLNWNPEGHDPAGVYDVPHFDFHFYIVERNMIDGIRSGPCAYFMNCDDYKRALLPVSAKYVVPDHINVNAAVAQMGNHLMDSKSPELSTPPKKFTHTWIFGAYDAHIIFYEPMITREFLQSQPNKCMPVKQPQAWGQMGYHPTKYCIRYRPDPGEYTVSLEGLVYRKAP